MNDLQRQVQFLRAIANDTRLEILKFLRPGPKMSEEIKTNFNLHRSVVQQNLSKLVINGILTQYRKGRYVMYELNNENVKRILDLLP